MQVGIIGGGFVGVTTATVLAEWGHEVHLVEIDAARREALQAGHLPFHEPGLENAWTVAAVRVVPSIEDLPAVAVAFLCVGTPSRPDGSADLSQVETATRELARTNRSVAVVVKSTVPPGTTANVVSPILTSAGLAPASMNPEFLREGCALDDARRADRVVLGTGDAGARELLDALYANVTCPVIHTDPTTAEMVKYASNAMLAVRIAFANEIANLCEPLGINVDEVMASVGLDKRIGPAFLRAGLGFGGSCFPKDVKALRAMAESMGEPMRILDAVLAGNEQQPLRAVAALERFLGALRGKRVAMLGLAFKPETSDVRETRALPIYEALVAQGAVVVCHDPEAGTEFERLVGTKVNLVETGEKALAGADACILVTEWAQYREIEAARFPAVVIDGRRHLDRQTLEAAGKTYIALGDGRATATPLREEAA